MKPTGKRVHFHLKFQKPYLRFPTSYVAEVNEEKLSALNSTVKNWLDCGRNGALTTFHLFMISVVLQSKSE